MQNADSIPPAPAATPRGPEVIFANWREMLNQLKLARDVRHAYAQAIEGYLDYCVRNGLSVGVETARGFVSDALRRGLTPDGATCKAALNWFSREGRKRSAPGPRECRAWARPTPARRPGKAG